MNIQFFVSLIPWAIHGTNEQSGYEARESWEQNPKVLCFIFHYNAADYDVCVSLSVCRYDFFLVSQHVRQGTVTPTHYNVVYDNSGLKPDHMQRCVRSSGYRVPLPLPFPVFHLLFSSPLPHGHVT